MLDYDCAFLKSNIPQDNEYLLFVTIYQLSYTMSGYVKYKNSGMNKS